MLSYQELLSTIEKVLIHSSHFTKDLAIPQKLEYILQYCIYFCIATEPTCSQILTFLQNTLEKLKDSHSSFHPHCSEATKSILFFSTYNFKAALNY